MKKYIKSKNEVIMHRILAILSLSFLSIQAWAGDSIPLADPYILLENGVYYAYGTHSADGIEVYTSTDLENWTLSGLALSKENTTETRWFWAPEVYRRGNVFYMFYSANEHLYVATSSSPTGPFRQEGGLLMQDLIGEEQCIDSSVFFDDDGKAYLYFVRFTDGNYIWMCDLDARLRPVRGTLRPCFGVSQPWEQHEGKVAEGPFVIKRRGIYYLTYSANDYRSQDYGVGYAISTSPYGPWQKSDTNPILFHHDGRYGTGHHSFFRDKKDRLRIVYHAHHSSTTVPPRMMYVGSAKFRKKELRVVSHHP